MKKLLDNYSIILTIIFFAVFTYQSSRYEQQAKVIENQQEEIIDLTQQLEKLLISKNQKKVIINSPGEDYVLYVNPNTASFGSKTKGNTLFISNY